jgi:phenylalanyl-tRNA synthetase beta chain
MLLPLSWLAQYVDDLPEPEELAHRLTMAGLEVEAIESATAEGMHGSLVVAQISEMGPHPGADRLALCQVDDGEGQRQIVCGARNMKVGDLVVLARPGTKLPGGMKIKKGKLRGEESAGMLCSSEELGLPSGEDGILILPEGVAPGTEAVGLLGLEETILEIAITPNRGDCLCVRGLAREASAVWGLPLTSEFHRESLLPSGVGRVPIIIEDVPGCALYRGLEIEGVQVGPSPLWLRSRLAGCGLRSVNNIVDVTNLILFEFGQPLHSFDRDRLAGPSIFVRAAGQEMPFETLDGTTVTLLEDDLVVADEAGPVALAGVMGGTTSAVSEGTTNVFLEAAQFDPARVRRTSRRLGLISDSSYRFERGIDAFSLEKALARAAELIVELAGGTIVGGLCSAGGEPAALPTVRVRPRRVNALLGTEIGTEKIEQIIVALGAAVVRDGDDLLVDPPSHRHDLGREVDFIEEVARINGYDNVATELPTIQIRGHEAPAVFRVSAALRQSLATSGLTECVGLAFSSSKMNSSLPGLHEASGQVVVRNPLRSDDTELRRSALGHLLEAHKLNVRNGRATTDLFSISRTFATGAEGPVEREVIAGVLSGARRDRGPGQGQAGGFWDAKGVLERALGALAPTLKPEWRVVADRPEYHPKACAGLYAGEALLGYVGKLHPDLAEVLEITENLALFEVDTLRVLEYAPAHHGFQPIGKFPSSSRDVSLQVPRALLAGEVISVVEGLGEDLVETVQVFDEYLGGGAEETEKALAFSIVYRAADRTLTDEEVAALHAKVVARVTEDLGVRVRA